MKLFQTLSKRDDLSCLDYSSTVNTNNSWILLPIFHLTHMPICTQGMPGVAESTVSIKGGKPSPWGEGARRAERGEGKVLFHGPHPLSRVFLPLPEGGGYSWDDGFCNFAFSYAQNDISGGDVRELNENKGRVHSFSHGADSAHLAFSN